MSPPSRHFARLRPVRRTNRAFSLIEAVIVLAIVGLVIGGIWASTKSTRDQQKAATLVRDILFMVNETRKLYRGQEWPDLVPDGNSVNINTVATRARLLPDNWIVGSQIISPYGFDPAASWSNGINVTLSPSGDEYILIGVSGLDNGASTGANQTDCNFLLKKTASMLANDPTFYQIQIAPTGGGAITYTNPVPATASCPAAFGTLRWWFRR